MNKYLLDTDIIIESLRGNRLIIERLAKLYKEENALFFSPVNKAEIYQGLRNGEQEKTESFFDTLNCIQITDEIGGKAGEYLRKYRKSHHLQLGDALIAASCFLSDCILFTLNRKHYPMRDIRFI